MAERNHNYNKKRDGPAKAIAGEKRPNINLIVMLYLKVRSDIIPLSLPAI